MDLLKTNMRGLLKVTSVLFLAVSFFSFDKDEKEREPIIPYTSEDATTAFEAFNEEFLNKEANLYYSTSERNGLGSIWTQAIYWDIIMDTYLRTDKPEYYTMITDVYQGAYDQYAGFNYENTEEWFIYDDIMWWVISLSRGYEITGNEEYLQNSIAGFERVWEGSHDPDRGGMYWDFAHSGKNACINYPTVIAAMKLYEITGDEEYFNKAKSVYEWSRNNLFQESTGRVADNSIRGNPGFSDYTYNQGTAIGAAVELYNATGNEAYLNDANLAADYTKNVMSNDEGILPAEGDWNEQGVLKAIFARYLMKLVEDGGQDQYESWLRKNANVAWHNRDKSRDIMFRDYDVPCPKGNIQSFEASSAVGIMQVVPPAE